MNNKTLSLPRRGFLGLGKLNYIVILILSFVTVGCNDDSGTNTQHANDSERVKIEKDDNGSKVTPPLNAQPNQLFVQFTRTPPTPPYPPGTQLENQEIPGRPFELKIYQVLSDTKVEDVTQKVIWRSETSDCQENSCYVVQDGRIIAKQELKAFDLVAEYDGQETSKIPLESLATLKRCETDISNRDQCIHIVEGTSGTTINKLFTEPPRVGVMRILGYSADSSYFNTGYTYEKYNFIREAKDGGDSFPRMMNSGFDSNYQSDGSVGAEGQYARYCRDLASLKFDGKNNWRRATQQELVELSNLGVVGVYGWPNSLYGTSTVVDERTRQLKTVVLKDGFTMDAYESESQLTICVAENI